MFRYCLGIFFLLNVLWASWLCGLVFLIKLREFCHYCFKYLFCSSLFLLFPVFLSCVYDNFCNCLIALAYPVLTFSFSFLSTFSWSFCWHSFKFIDSVLSHIQSVHELSRALFIFVKVFCDCYTPFWFLEFSSLLHHPSVLACSPHFLS